MESALNGGFNNSDERRPLRERKRSELGLARIRYTASRSGPSIRKQLVLAWMMAEQICRRRTDSD
jgi:hypothetical protein